MTGLFDGEREIQCILMLQGAFFVRQTQIVHDQTEVDAGLSRDVKEMELIGHAASIDARLSCRQSRFVRCRQAGRLSIFLAMT